MDITLKPFRATGHPKPVASFKVTEKSWKIFTYHSQLSDFYELAKNLEKKEKIQAQTMLMQLGQRCESGQPLENMYDSKKLHDSCIFQLIIANTQKEDKIYRIRHGNLRLYFIYYSPRKEIILLTILIKKEKKLPKSVEVHLKNLASSIYDPSNKINAILA